MTRSSSASSPSTRAVVGVLLVEQNAKQALAIGHTAMSSPPAATASPTAPQICWRIGKWLNRFWVGEAGLSDFINLYLLPGLAVGCIYALGRSDLDAVRHPPLCAFRAWRHDDARRLSGDHLHRRPRLEPLTWRCDCRRGTAGAALALDRAFYKPFRRAPGIVTVIASFGVMLMLRSAIQLIWGVDVKTYYSGGIQMPMVFGMLKIAPRLIVIVLATAALVIALHLFLSRTRLGKAMRAVSDDPDLAAFSGINVEQVIRWTWIIGAGLAAAGGVFIGIQTKVHPSMGWDLLLPLFAAAVLGGIGRPYGAVAGRARHRPDARSWRPIRGSPTIPSSRRATSRRWLSR
jgi:hypothetical protein